MKIEIKTTKNDKHQQDLNEKNKKIKNLEKEVDQPGWKDNHTSIMPAPQS